jgi:ketosteroid isomerase-like protein
VSITEEQVKSIFAKLGGDNRESFFDHVADNVSWTALGTHPLSGHYASRGAFRQATFARLGS